MYIFERVTYVYYRAVHMDVLGPQSGLSIHQPDNTRADTHTMQPYKCVNDAVGAAHGFAAAQARSQGGDSRASVNIVHEHETNFSVNCKNCNKSFCGGATRIEAHIHHPQRLHL